MSNFIWTRQGRERFAFAKVLRLANPVYAALINKKQTRFLIAGLLLLLLCGTSNHAFAFGTTYYYPNSVTASGGGTYCVGTAATGLTGTVFESSATATGGTSATVTWQWYYNTSGAAGTLTGATLVTSGSYTADAGPDALPLASASITTATPGVYYYFLYVTAAGGTTSSGPFFSGLVTVTVNGTLPITGPNSVCVGSTINLADATTGGTWSSSNTGVATVAGGTVLGVSNGTATISYAAGGCTPATMVVSVVAAPSAISGPGTVCMGSNITLSDSPNGGVWSSSSTGVATIGASNGTISTVSTGTTTIMYSDGCGSPATVVVTVNPLPAAITGPSSVCPDGATITLNDATSGGTWSATPASVASATTIPPNTGIITGGTVSGTAVVTYTSPLNCIATTVITVDPLPSPISGVLYECANTSTTLSDAVPGGTWSSSIPPVALVSSSASGSVIGISAGTAVITYVTGCGYVTAVDTVFAAPSIFASYGDSVCTGDTTSFAFLPVGGTWNSGANSIATVLPGSGVITGISAGSANITYTTPRGCFAYKTIYVNATPQPIAGVMHLCPGTSVTLTDPTTGGSWSTLEGFIASASGSVGTVTGVSAGTATIVYRDGSSCIVSAVVTVNPAPLPIVGGATSCSGIIDTLYDATSDGVWSSATPTIGAVTAVLFDTSAAITALNGGTVTISYTLPTGCAATKSFKVNPLPLPIVTYNWIDFTFYTGTFYTSYQWYDSYQGLIVGATVPQTAAQYTANYWVVVSDTNGCTGQSVPIAYNTAQTGITTQTKTQIHVYPNPAKQTVYIETAVNVRAVISDVDGKTELEQSNAKELDISRLADGVYFISLYGDDGQRLRVEKLVKQ